MLSCKEMIVLSMMGNHKPGNTMGATMSAVKYLAKTRGVARLKLRLTLNRTRKQKRILSPNLPKYSFSSLGYSKLSSYQLTGGRIVDKH
jgi:hypothetical protein